MAERFGMTDFVNPSEVEGDLVPYLVNLTKGGADYTFDATGNVQVMRAALNLRTKDGGKHHYWCGPSRCGNFNPSVPIGHGRVWRGTAFGGAWAHGCPQNR